MRSLRLGPTLMLTLVLPLLLSLWSPADLAGEDGWTSHGPPYAAGNSIAVHPMDPNLLFAAGESGVFKSIDGGDSWIQLDPANAALTGLAYLAVDPSDPSKVYAAGSIRVPTPELNRWLQEASAHERAGPAGGRSIRLFYATQTGVHPPRFVLFCNHPERVHFSIRRRLENDLRERFGFGPAPMRLQFRGRRDGKDA